ncbi:phospholipase/carboxylesterase [Singulisphaera sp. GP187]|uniref:alpha/beta hydrolase n=1 Tax=Singulisphaera sp. GP187 TaxID=1882752 RepID=UPI0009295EE7|nr:esterase [Singulisphaera sp. GP187]SIO46227.1 phospholipase/carboxylesterase [Singulisphaera sp. GP187]
MSSDRLNAPFHETTTGTGSLVESRFVPQRYEPNYPYPLLVLLHSRGGDEQQMVRSMPALSWRNYVGLSLRGPEPAIKRGRAEGYSWGSEFARPDRRVPRPCSSFTEADVVRQRLIEGTPDAIDSLEDGLFSSIRQTRRALHVHSERIFLVGCGEGAAVAYRIALSYPERFAGVVAINGWLPGGFRPLARLKACRDLRILVVHGEWNARVPVQSARRDVRVLRAGGLRVAFQSYPCAHRLTSPMLSDVDTWLINHCTNED